MERGAFLPLIVAFALMSGCAGWGKMGASPVSAGSSKLILKPTSTTPLEILEAFGEPDSFSGDARGNETWVYRAMGFASAGEGQGKLTAAFGSPATGGLFWGRVAEASASTRTLSLTLKFLSGVLVDFAYESDRPRD